MKADDTDRLNRALADVYHTPVGVAAFKRWALDTAQRPGPHLVALYGPSGTGKTELIRRVGRGLFESAHVATLQLGSYQRAMEVTGTPLGIVAARPSPFAAALMARRGRPVIMAVDEVDKAPEEV